MSTPEALVKAVRAKISVKKKRGYTIEVESVGPWDFIPLTPRGRHIPGTLP
jgi:hypothetical protein